MIIASTPFLYTSALEAARGGEQRRVPDHRGRLAACLRLLANASNWREKISAQESATLAVADNYMLFRSVGDHRRASH